MIPDLKNISTWKYTPTQDTMEKCNKVLDYASTYPNVNIWYHAIDMILMKDTYAAYLFLPAAHSCIAGHYYFRNHILDYSKGNPTPNGHIWEECNTLKTMVSSSSEA